MTGPSATDRAAGPAPGPNATGRGPGRLIVAVYGVLAIAATARSAVQILRDLDDAGRVPGAPVGTVDEALDYLRRLEREEYLDG